MGIRKIIFRGKEIDTGKWVYGSLLYSAYEDQYFIEKNDGFVLSYPVREETIGQYTGLEDKNGKKIFEGDIAKDILGDVGPIIYEEKHAAFVIDKWECGFTLWFDK